jgi:hypothetical protein
MTFDPFQTPPHPQTEEEQRETVHRLARDANLAVDTWVMAHRDELLGEVTAASRTDLIIRAALGYLVGLNLITLTENPPEWLPLDIPAHLQPDIDAAKNQYRRLQARLP